MTARSTLNSRARVAGLDLCASTRAACPCQSTSSTDLVPARSSHALMTPSTRRWSTTFGSTSRLYASQHLARVVISSPFVRKVTHWDRNGRAQHGRLPPNNSAHSRPDGHTLLAL